MNHVIKIMKYGIIDLIRNRWILLYITFFFLMTDLMIRFVGEPARVIINLTEIVLILVPLITLLFGIIYLYGSREFINMLLAQPIGRTQLYTGIYAGISGSLAMSFLVGTALPFIIHGIAGGISALFYLLLVGGILTLIFSGIAFLITIIFEDRVKAFGFAIALWLLVCLFYDGLILMIIYTYSDYPLESLIIALNFLNPVDLSRLILLLQFDISAMMGYSGAVFKQFFGTQLSFLLTVFSLAAWTFIPFYFGRRRFSRKDF